MTVRNAVEKQQLLRENRRYTEELKRTLEELKQSQTPMPITGTRSPLFGMALVTTGREAARARPWPRWTAVPKAPTDARNARRETFEFSRERDMALRLG